MNNGLLIVISSPSGGGKGTILKKLFENNNKLCYSVSATTRNPRPGEENGKEYYFINKAEFKALIAEGKMLEYAEYCDNFYGTPMEPVEKQRAKGLDVILEIEVQGGTQIKNKVEDSISIFISPPSMEILEQRLKGRGTETDDIVRKRLETAKKELNAAAAYDYIVINDTVEKAADEISAILTSEKLKVFRNKATIERMTNNA